MQTLKLTEEEIGVIEDSLASVAWLALPKQHPQRIAYISLLRKLAKLAQLVREAV